MDTPTEPDPSSPTSAPGPLPEAAGGRPSPAARKRFWLALAVFVLWVAVLALLALVSAKRPEVRPSQGQTSAAWAGGRHPQGPVGPC